MRAGRARQYPEEMMRLRMIAGFLVLTAGLSITIPVIVRSVHGQRSSDQRDASVEDPKTTWEYLVVSGGHSSVESVSGEQLSSSRKQGRRVFPREAFVLERNLDQLGDRGWELVAVHGSPGDPVYYLKRRKDLK